MREREHQHVSDHEREKCVWESTRESMQENTCTREHIGDVQEHMRESTQESKQGGEHAKERGSMQERACERAETCKRASTCKGGKEEERDGAHERAHARKHAHEHMRERGST